MTTAPRVTRSLSDISTPAAATDAAIEREAQRQRDVRSLLIKPLYRDPTREELATMAVQPELRERFAAFLSLPGTGITRLLTDIGCSSSTRTVSASPECLSRTVPGSGSSFSFRKKNYTIRRFADLFFNKGIRSASGQHYQAAVASLSDKTIETVTLDDPQVMALSSIPQASTISESQRPLSGAFFRSFVPREGTTYAMRYIAYRGEVQRSVRGVVYNELKYDRRSDILVVFYVVATAADGMTMIWRVLSDKRSPELKK